MAQTGLDAFSARPEQAFDLPPQYSQDLVVMSKF
jgi:hypothetical protein